MDLALLIARFLLAIVFLVAGLTKLADLKGSRQALRDFGVPAPLARPFDVVLPLTELAVAVALIPTASAWWGALGALTLLLLFIAGISHNLIHGRTPDCHCFGQLYSKPIGWPTLVRNLMLAAIAGLVVGFGRTNAGLSAIDRLGGLALAQRIELLAGIVVLALLACESWFLFQTLRQQGQLLLRLEAVEAQLAATGLAVVPLGPAHGLPIGTVAPSFRLTPLSSSDQHAEEAITLEALRTKGKPVVLIFIDPDCGLCKALLPEISRWQRDYAGKLTLTLISRGSPEDNRSKTSEHGITQVLLQQDREVAQAYQAYGTPSAVLVLQDGTIGSPLARRAEAIRGLIAGTVGI